MQPYYDRDGIQVYHGDTLNVLDEIALDASAVLMDPPYSSGARTEAGKAASGQMLRGTRFAKPIDNDHMTTPGFIWLMREVCLLLAPMLRDGSAVLSFIDWRQWSNLIGPIESANLRVNGMIVWDKMTMGTGNGFRSQHELICYASKGKPNVVDRGVPNVLQYKRDRVTKHPSPKPVELLVRLLTAVTVPNDLIVDPFMGAGSTLVAAAQLGCRAVGIEMQEEYCELAAKRLDEQLDTEARFTS